MKTKNKEDERFKFKRTRGGYILTEFYNKFNSTVLYIPSVHKKRPVVEIGAEVFVHAFYLQEVIVPEGVRRIGDWAFHSISSLRRVSLPASLEKIGSEAFSICSELSEVEFRSDPSLGECVFSDDFKLPAELILAGQTGSLDITQAIGIEKLKNELNRARELKKYLPWFTHAGAFALAAQNDSFREADKELLDGLIDYCVNKKMVEQTAYFLELKKEKYGFNGGDDFEL